MNALSNPLKTDYTPAQEAELPTYDARQMVGDGVQARLVLDGVAYYLRLTKAGKLILTK